MMQGLYPETSRMALPHLEMVSQRGDAAVARLVAETFALRPCRSLSDAPQWATAPASLQVHLKLVDAATA